MPYEQLQLPGFTPCSHPTGFVYIGARGGQIKIGFSKRPLTRFRELGLTPLRVLSGTVDDERGLHRRFRAAHIDREWFLPTPELLAFACDYDNAA